jgi:hypothetical protein
MSDRRQSFIVFPPESTRAGWLVSRVYPFILGKTISGEDTELVKRFMENQPNNITDLLKWESKKFDGANPEIDPLPMKFINTPHPIIKLSRPRRWGRRSGRVPFFYVCPTCLGRLFSGLPICPFCGLQPAEHVDPGTGDPDVYLNMMDYLFPQSSKPAVSAVIASLKASADKIDLGDTSIRKPELDAVLKNIDQYIPD